MRGLEEALIRAKVPYVIIEDVGVYQRNEIKDALSLRAWRVDQRRSARRVNRLAMILCEFYG
ncbi:MAG: hypothetical protein ACRYG8_51830 [Janthinobacterium lividum]